MMVTSKIGKVILVPGLFEPRGLLVPLAHRLRNAGYRATLWRDRVAFRDLHRSVDRLATAIRIADSVPDDHRDVALVTHSFGDWVARAAIRSTPRHRIAALVSITPVMRGGWLFAITSRLGGGCIPEVSVIADAERASANLQCDANLTRLVIWARLDGLLRSVNLSDFANVTEQSVWSSHLSAIVQPSIGRMVVDFVQRADSGADGLLKPTDRS